MSTEVVSKNCFVKSNRTKAILGKELMKIINSYLAIKFFQKLKKMRKEGENPSLLYGIG